MERRYPDRSAAGFFIVSTFVYSYEYLGEFSTGNNSPRFRVFKSTKSMDAYILMTDEIKEALEHNLLIMKVTSHQETHGLGDDLKNLFRKTGGDLLAAIVAGFNGPEIYVYYFANEKYYIYSASFYSLN
jgi:hypothetical protein